MAPDEKEAGKAKREFAQLIRIQERIMGRLNEIREELKSPAAVKLVREIRSRTGSGAVDELAQVTAAVEEAIRQLKLTESATRQEFLDEQGDTVTVEGVPNLPAHLARFLAERTKFSRFSYEVRQDPIRGWIISWKERTEGGTIRGFGQFYERPYAWLDE